MPECGGVLRPIENGSWNKTENIFMLGQFLLITASYWNKYLNIKSVID